MWHIFRLATTEVTNESTHEIFVFSGLFNEIVIDIIRRDYKFNLRAIMGDENDTNYCAMQKVFGLDFVTTKVVSCQMHYTYVVNRVSFRIGPSYRDLFKSICHGMCSIATMAQYNKKKKWLDEIANIFLNISWWLTWWDARTYHMFPALFALATQLSPWPRSAFYVQALHAIMAVGGCLG